MVRLRLYEAGRNGKHIIDLKGSVQILNDGVVRVTISKESVRKFRVLEETKR
ncbi:MAG: hypothetical protein L6243_03710 [Candidatus Altiarchaeales archaeon]|nr:hypothetical protein [Candidatus Altiarchaeota archaeon]MBU4341843.1 hypothetical protein [Candidatus Altiarchaeota archaeon]MBU4406287.1 hypothetical protein [Candidatus Altiarchaeota archaeon]MBU4437707.1 hypothetical protein [Candidatus Altiarchaeota archaeon]MCG2782676.1 hypothetical protein [Candidatus Altiarchaeales archaeon]